MEYDELITHYKDTKSKLSQYKIAQLEEQIWSFQPKKSGDRRKWFYANFGGIQNDYEVRAALFAYGEPALPLWDRIDKGLGLYVSIQLMRNAKKKASAEQKFLSKEIVQFVLEEYDNQKKAAPVKLIFKNENPNGTRQLKADIQVLVEKYMVAFSNIDDYELKQYKNELIELMDDAIESVNRKIWRRNRGSKIENLHTRIGRTNFIHALDVLGLKSTEFIFGKQIDLKRVRKAKVERLKYLHPDSNNGSRETEAEFNNVNNAYVILETYSEQI